DLQLWRVPSLTCGDSVWRSPFMLVTEFREHPTDRPTDRPSVSFRRAEILGASRSVECADRAARARSCATRGRGRGSRYSPGGRYWTSWALRSASIVSSTVRRTVVSSELSAPPPVIASATAAMDTLSGASHRV